MFKFQLIGKIEKRTKPTKESPARKPEPDKTKHKDGKKSYKFHC